MNVTGFCSSNWDISMAPRVFDRKLRSREAVEQIGFAWNGAIQAPRPSLAADSVESFPLACPGQLEHAPFRQSSFGLSEAGLLN